MTMKPNTNDQPHLDQVLNRFDKPVVVFKTTDDIEPIVNKANVAFRDVFAPVESVTGHSLNDLIVPPAHRSEARKFAERISNGNSNTAIIERATTDGRRTFFYHSIPVGQNKGFAIYSDITEKIRPKEQLEILHEAFHTNICKELGEIICGVNNILNTSKDEKVEDALDEIKESTADFKRLCLEAHTARQVITGSSQLEPINLNRIIRSVSKDCLRRFEQARISTHCPQDISVWADSSLRIVVDNLIDNAVRHNNSSLPEVKISVDVLGADIVELKVVDDGPGIPQAVQEICANRILKSSISQYNGLGLLLVKWLVETYDGRLTINTSQEDGSDVRVRLKRVEI